MSLHNSVKANMILSSIEKYTSKKSSRDIERLEEITASDSELLTLILGPDFFMKAAAESAAVSKAKALDADKANDFVGVDKDLEEGFNSWFFDLMSKKLGKEAFSEDRNESETVTKERKKALESFYRVAKAKLFKSLSKTYSDYMRTPDAKKITLRKLVLDPDKKEYVEDTDFKRVSVELTGEDFGDGKKAIEFPFEDAFSAIRDKTGSELQGINAKNFEDTSNQRSYRIFTMKEPIDRKYKGEQTPTKYEIEVRNIGEFLDKAKAMFNPGELSDQLPSILADMFAFYKGKSDLIKKDKKGNDIVGENELNNAIASSFEGGERGSDYGKSKEILTFFSPKIDSQRYSQLVKLYEKADGEQAKTAFNVGDFNLKDLNLDGIIDDKDIAEFDIGDPDTFLLDELKTKGDIMYRVEEIAPGAKGKDTFLTISFPELEESGFLTSGQKYTVKVPVNIGFKTKEEYHFTRFPGKSGRRNSIKVKLKEQSEAAEKAGIDTAKEVGLTGQEITKLTQRMVDTFLSKMKSLPKDKFIEYFGKMVILNGKAMANSSDLGDLIRAEEEEFEKYGPGLKGENKARQYLEEFKEEEEEKEQDVADVWGRENLVKFLLDQGLDKKSSPLIDKIVKHFPAIPSNTKNKAKAVLSQPFVKWLLDTISFGTKGMVDKVYQTDVWSVLVQKKISNGDIFKESPEFDKIYTGDRNEEGGIAGLENLSNLSRSILKPIMDEVEEAIIQLYLSGDKYIQDLLKVNTSKAEGPLKDFQAKYEGGTDTKGKKHVGLDNLFAKALDDNDSKAIMELTGMTPKTITNEDKEMIRAIQEADIISKKDRKYFQRKYDAKKKAEKKEVNRKALFPRRKNVKEASADRSMISKIVNTVMSRRGYYNV
jgi:hypothetical protein